MRKGKNLQQESATFLTTKVVQVKKKDGTPVQGGEKWRRDRENSRKHAVPQTYRGKKGGDAVETKESRNFAPRKRDCGGGGNAKIQKYVIIERVLYLLWEIKRHREIPSSKENKRVRVSEKNAGSRPL